MKPRSANSPRPSGTRAAAPACIRGRLGTPDFRRFSVYRNNIAVGLIAALEARYPVTQRIVGAEAFRTMARAFARERSRARR